VWRLAREQQERRHRLDRDHRARLTPGVLFLSSSLRENKGPAKVCVGAVLLAAGAYLLARKKKIATTQRRLSHRQASMPSVVAK